MMYHFKYRATCPFHGMYGIYFRRCTLPALLKQTDLDHAQELYAVMCANRDAAVTTSLPETFCEDVKEMVCHFIDSPFEAKEVGFYLKSLSGVTKRELRIVRGYARWTLKCYSYEINAN